MTICVAGMHRSGTSMVMSLLHGLGLHIGDPADLMPANASNPDGHWEHMRFVEVADAALGVLGGGWDCPPAPAPESSPGALRELRRRALSLKADVGQAQPWGWKDPRASLLLPFWFGVYPELQVIVCLRNPLDVAHSLRSRGHSSYALGLSLWQAYNGRILSGSRPEQRLVTHYGSFFERPEPELRRLAVFAGLTPALDVLHAAAQRIKSERCHHASTRTDLQDAGVSPEIVDLYRRLCDEADWHEPVTHTAGAGREARPLDAVLLELAAARRQIAALTNVIADAERAQEDAARSAEERGTADERTAYEQLAGEVRGLTGIVHGDQQRLDRIDRQLAELRASAVELTQRLDDQARAREYQRGIRTIRQIVSRVVPRNSTIAVVSKGDEDLLYFTERHGVHFPPHADGGYAGHHPRDSAEALHLLELARRQGAEYLLIPYASFWWLDHYAEFAAHLTSVHALVCQDEMCVIYGVSSHAGEEVSEGRRRGSTCERTAHATVGVGPTGMGSWAGPTRDSEHVAREP